MKTISLSQGYVTTVDDEDYACVSAHNWYAWTKTRNGETQLYAVRTVQDGATKHTVYMHHEILERRDGYTVDHRSQDTLDNTRANLRYATVGQNNANRRAWNQWSDYKGVYPHGTRWRAGITIHGKMRHLGVFTTMEEAAQAYNKAAIERHGEFARLNELA